MIWDLSHPKKGDVGSDPTGGMGVGPSPSTLPLSYALPLQGIPIGMGP